MKLRSVVANNRKAQFELTTRAGKVYPLPYAKLNPRPTSEDRVCEVYVDPELAREAITYTLESGAEGSVPLDAALEYNADPAYMNQMLTHRLTVEALERVERSGLSRRELARRLGTSTPQLYRLLDTKNPRKNLAQLIALLRVLDCTVEVHVSER